MANMVLKVGSGLSKQNLRNALSFIANKQNVGKFLESLAKVLQDNDSLEIQLVNSDAGQASGTITFSGVGAADDTILVNGVTFTAVASGAVGNQWNVGASATASAANLAAAISASSSALVTNHVYATAAAGVVTVKAKTLGLDGNANTIAEDVDGSGEMAVSGARLTGGTAETAASISYRNW